MITLIKDQLLKINYKKGNGAWTYHLVIPNTAHLQGKWGSLKASGQIDDYVIEEINLAPRKNKDKLISINKDIRDALQKTGGDEVKVTLHLHDYANSLLTPSEIIRCFKDAGVLKAYDALSAKEQQVIRERIQSKPTGDQQVKEINQVIADLS